MDIELAIAEMIGAIYQPLAGKVVNYDTPTPEIDSETPLYAIVQLESSEVGYILAGALSGRRLAQFELTLVGQRTAVVAAEAVLPHLLSAHYIASTAAGSITIAGAMLISATGVSRQVIPNAPAGARMQFQAEVF